MIARRAFVATVASGALAVSRAVAAQPAGKVHRIGLLRVGPSSAELHEQPTRLGMVIELKTAKAPGSSIPPAWLARTGLVIE